MPKYRVKIHGRNYLLSMDGAPKRMGCFKTYFLEAAAPENAMNMAVEKIAQDPKWLGKILNAPESPPVLSLHELAEIDSFDGIPSLEQGYILYPDRED